MIWALENGKFQFHNSNMEHHPETNMEHHPETSKELEIVPAKNPNIIDPNQQFFCGSVASVSESSRFG